MRFYAKPLFRFIATNFSLAMVGRQQCELERPPKCQSPNDRSGRTRDGRAPHPELPPLAKTRSPGLAATTIHLGVCNQEKPASDPAPACPTY